MMMDEMPNAACRCCVVHDVCLLCVEHNISSPARLLCSAVSAVCHWFCLQETRSTEYVFYLSIFEHITCTQMYNLFFVVVLQSLYKVFTVTTPEQS